MRLKPQNANDSQILVKGRKAVDFQRFDEGSNPSFSAIMRRYELFIVRNVFGLTIKIEDR